MSHAIRTTGLILHTTIETLKIILVILIYLKFFNI